MLFVGQLDREEEEWYEEGQGRGSSRAEFQPEGGAYLT
jgi:hypothetical protein